MFAFYHYLLVFGLVLGFISPLQQAAAQVADATQVTDPDELESMGFARDADNVYMDNAARVATESDEDATSARRTLTTGIDYSAISAKEFIGRIDTSGTQWRYTGGPNCCVDLRRIGPEQFADAQFWLPTNSRLTFFRSWAFDNNASNLSFFVFEVCQPTFGAGAPTINVIASTSTSGTPGNTTVGVNLDHPVNNRDCIYLARVRFAAASSNLVLQKVRLQFRR